MVIESDVDDDLPSDKQFDWSRFEIDVATDYSSSSTADLSSDASPDLVANPSSADQHSKVANVLAQWVVQCRIAHQSASKLLNILHKEANLTYLPLDVRTLLETRREKVNLIEVTPGKYSHFDIEAALFSILMAMESVGIPIPQILKILFNIDGIPVSKSSRSEFWPILCKVLGKHAAFAVVAVPPLTLFKHKQETNCIVQCNSF